MAEQLLFDEICPDSAFHAVLTKKQEAFEPHYHDFYEIVLVTRGSGQHVSGDAGQKSIELHPGSICLVRPPDIHTIVPRGEITFFNIAFAVQPFEEFCEFADLQADLERWKNAESTPVYIGHELESLCVVLSRQFASQQTQKLELIKLWSEVAALFQRAERQQAASILPDWLARALKGMQSEENLRGGFQRLCQIGHVSSAHMARSFQTYLGQTPTQWLTTTRLNVAATYLLETPLPVSEIAFRCGFENLPYFYRVFKVRFGTSPRAFRQQAHRVVGDLR